MVCNQLVSKCKLVIGILRRYTLSFEVGEEMQGYIFVEKLYDMLTIGRWPWLDDFEAAFVTHFNLGKKSLNNNLSLFHQGDVPIFVDFNIYFWTILEVMDKRRHND